MKISKFLNIFIPILSATTIVAVPSTLAGIEAHNFVPAPVPPGPTPPEPTKDIVLNELSFITDDGENVLPFIQSEEMSIYANKEYEIKISMSVWSSIVTSWPYSYWYFGFGTFGELSSIAGTSVSPFAKNKLYVNGTEITNGVSVHKMDDVDLNVFLTNKTPLYGTDELIVKLTFTDRFANGRFAMFPGL